jgi:hypothetical protein
MPNTTTNAKAVERRETKKRMAVVSEKTSELPTDVQMVIDAFDAAWKYCKGGLHDRWNNNYKLYHGQRVKRGYNGITDTFVPMAYSTVETKVSALYGANPKINFLPPHQKQDQKTDILNSLYDYYAEKDQWPLKNINTGRTKLTLGTAIDYYCWDIDHICKLNIPTRDFFIDPTATSIEDARYMGRRYLTTVDQLKEFEIVDWENPVEAPVLDEMGQPVMDEMGTIQTETTYNMKPKYKNFDKLEAASQQVNGKGSQSGDEKTDKQEKDMFYGSTLEDGVKGQVEVIEYWTNDKVISVANRSVEIENEENYFKAKARANGVENPRGIIPFNSDRCYVDPSLFYGKGEVDFLADQQELLNDITNQNIDSITYTLNQMYTLDPAYAHLITKIQNIPGAVYPIAKDALNPIIQRPVPPDAFNERMNIKNEIRETTASNEVVKGAGESAGGKATATEINAQVAGSGQRMGLMVTQLENEYFHREARIFLALVRLYVTEPIMVRILGQDGAKWEEFDPKDFQDGDYDPRAQLDVAIQNQKKEDAANAKEMYAAFMGDPDVNQVWLKKKVLSAGFQLDPDEVEEAFQPNPMPAMQPGMPGDPGAPPDGAGMPQEDQMLGQPTGNIDHLPPHVANQLPPDVTPEEIAHVQQAMGAGV